MTSCREEWARQLFTQNFPWLRGRILNRIRVQVGRGELIAEAIALAWKYVRRLCLKGRDPTRFLGIVAKRAAQHALAGRTVAARNPKGHLRRKDRSPEANGVILVHIGRPHSEARYLSAAFADRKRPDPAAQAIFRLDTSAWLNELTTEKRAIAVCLAEGTTTTAAASRFHLTPGRISQLRRELANDYRQFLAR